MMRALYSSVAGLKTHQTKMDVLGNNIANVNTVGFKSTRVTFSTMIYQKTSSASGANAETGKGGINAKQIGLGSTFASTTISVATGGANESTGNAFDLKLTDTNSTSFFVVSNGSENMFTRAGAFYVDGAGNLCMESTGYTVMGWQVDNAGNIKKDTVSPLKVMSSNNQTSEPEYTTKAVCSGILDDNSSNVNTDSGYTMNLNFFDNLGYPYTAKFAAKINPNVDGQYTVSLTNILDSKGKSILGGLEMGKLFGTGNSANQQGGMADITDNYVLASGKSNALKEQARKLQSTGEGNDAATTRTYTFTGETANSVFGTTFPSDLKIEFTVPIDNDNNQTEPYVGVGGTIRIFDASGNNVTEDYKTMTTDAGTMVFAKSEGASSDPTTVKITMDTPTVENGAVTNPPTVTDGALTGVTMARKDTLQSVLKNLEDKGALTFVNGVCTVDDISLAQINASLSATVSSNAEITISKSNVGVYTINSTDTNVATAWANAATALPTTSLTSSSVLPLGYLTVLGSAANDQQNNGPFFTENLPADVEIHYYGDGHYTIVTPRSDGFTLQFSTADGTLQYVGQQGSMSQTLNLADAFSEAGNFSNISIDFSTLKNLANNGSSTAAISGGDSDGLGRGKKVGALTGLSVDTSGKIFGTYDNGNTALLGQIAVARFANASGLESVGENCFKTTLNSGEFDGIGVEIDADGSSITTGVLEMSNVDLATEFTQMITTQRGYQANSRVITTSDSILEELINLKR